MVAKRYKFDHPELGDDRISAITLSNFTYQMVLIDVLFEDNTEMRFCRDWDEKVHANWGEVKFRTAWSSGWYLSHLSSLGVIDLV